MDIRKVKKLIELMHETGVFEIEVKEGEESVRLQRLPEPTQTVIAAPAAPAQTVNVPAAAPQAATPVTPAAPEGQTITSPMVGTAYLASSPDKPPFVKVGQRVKVGDTLCLIEAMKMFNNIEADIAGTIVACNVSDGEPVEFGQPLFIIDPNA